MDAPGLQEGAQQGQEQAERAGKAMRDGDPMGATGGQRAAEEGFRQAREALEEAQKNLQEMQRASRSRGQKKDGKDGKDEGKDPKNGDDESSVDDDMPLPAPEAFKTPEEYRKALLEGMSGDVPEEYKALNRRYYEELVRQ